MNRVTDKYVNIHYNPDFLNSYGTKKIIRNIGFSKNQSIQIKRVDDLSKNVQYTNIIIWV